MTATVAMWVGGIVIAIIFGLLGLIWKDYSKKLGQAEDDVEDNSKKIVALESEMDHLKSNADVHDREIRELATSLKQLSDSVSTLSEFVAKMDTKAEERAAAMSDKFEGLVVSIADKIKLAMLEVGQELREQSRKELQEHISKCPAQRE